MPTVIKAHGDGGCLFYSIGWGIIHAFLEDKLDSQNDDFKNKIKNLLCEAGTDFFEVSENNINITFDQLKSNLKKYLLSLNNKDNFVSFEKKLGLCLRNIAIDYIAQNRSQYLNSTAVLLPVAFEEYKTKKIKDDMYLRHEFIQDYFDRVRKENITEEDEDHTKKVMEWWKQEQGGFDQFLTAMRDKFKYAGDMEADALGKVLCIDIKILSNTGLNNRLGDSNGIPLTVVYETMARGDTHWNCQIPEEREKVPNYFKWLPKMPPAAPVFGEKHLKKFREKQENFFYRQHKIPITDLSSSIDEYNQEISGCFRWVAKERKAQLDAIDNLMNEYGDSSKSLADTKNKLEFLRELQQIQSSIKEKETSILFKKLDVYIKSAQKKNTAFKKAILDQKELSEADKELFDNIKTREDFKLFFGNNSFENYQTFKIQEGIFYAVKERLDYSFFQWLELNISNKIIQNEIPKYCAEIFKNSDINKIKEFMAKLLKLNRIKKDDQLTLESKKKLQLNIFNRCVEYYVETLKNPGRDVIKTRSTALILIENIENSDLSFSEKNDLKNTVLIKYLHALKIIFDDTKESVEKLNIIKELNEIINKCREGASFVLTQDAAINNALCEMAGDYINSCLENNLDINKIDDQLADFKKINIVARNYINNFLNYLRNTQTEITSTAAIDELNQLGKNKNLDVQKAIQDAILSKNYNFSMKDQPKFNPVNKLKELVQIVQKLGENKKEAKDIKDIIEEAIPDFKNLSQDKIEKELQLEYSDAMAKLEKCIDKIEKNNFKIKGMENIKQLFLEEKSQWNSYCFAENKTFYINASGEKKEITDPEMIMTSPDKNKIPEMIASYELRNSVKQYFMGLLKSENLAVWEAEKESILEFNGKKYGTHEEVKQWVLEYAKEVYLSDNILEEKTNKYNFLKEKFGYLNISDSVDIISYRNECLKKFNETLTFIENIISSVRISRHQIPFDFQLTPKDAQDFAKFLGETELYTLREKIKQLVLEDKNSLQLKGDELSLARQQARRTYENYSYIIVALNSFQKLIDGYTGKAEIDESDTAVVNNFSKPLGVRAGFSQLYGQSTDNRAKLIDQLAKSIKDLINCLDNEKICPKIKFFWKGEDIDVKKQELHVVIYSIIKLYNKMMISNTVKKQILFQPIQEIVKDLLPKSAEKALLINFYNGIIREDGFKQYQKIEQQLNKLIDNAVSKTPNFTDYLELGYLLNNPEFFSFITIILQNKTEKLKNSKNSIFCENPLLKQGLYKMVSRCRLFNIKDYLEETYALQLKGGTISAGYAALAFSFNNKEHIEKFHSLAMRIYEGYMENNKFYNPQKAQGIFNKYLSILQDAEKNNINHGFAEFYEKNKNNVFVQKIMREKLRLNFDVLWENKNNTRVLENLFQEGSESREELQKKIDLIKIFEQYVFKQLFPAAKTLGGMWDVIDEKEDEKEIEQNRVENQAEVDQILAKLERLPNAIKIPCLSVFRKDMYYKELREKFNAIIEDCVKLFENLLNQESYISCADILLNYLRQLDVENIDAFFVLAENKNTIENQYLNFIKQASVENQKIFIRQYRHKIIEHTANNLSERENISFKRSMDEINASLEIFQKNISHFDNKIVNNTNADINKDSIDQDKINFETFKELMKDLTKSSEETLQGPLKLAIYPLAFSQDAEYRLKLARLLLENPAIYQALFGENFNDLYQFYSDLIYNSRKGFLVDYLKGLEEADQSEFFEKAKIQNSPEEMYLKCLVELSDEFSDEDKKDKQIQGFLDYLEKLDSQQIKRFFEKAFDIKIKTHYKTSEYAFLMLIQLSPDTAQKTRLAALCEKMLSDRNIFHEVCRFSAELITYKNNVLSKNSEQIQKELEAYKLTIFKYKAFLIIDSKSTEFEDKLGETYSPVKYVNRLFTQDEMNKKLNFLSILKIALESAEDITAAQKILDDNDLAAKNAKGKTESKFKEIQTIMTQIKSPPISVSPHSSARNLTQWGLWGNSSNSGRFPVLLSPLGGSGSSFNRTPTYASGMEE